MPSRRFPLKSSILGLAVALAVGAAAYLALRPRPYGWLNDLLGVVSVERAVMPARPAGTIIHLRDWHIASDQEQDDRHLADVERVQAEQVVVLRELVARGIRAVGVEGLTEP